MGIFRDIQWQVHSLHLPEQFSLVCFSDGVLEILPSSKLEQKEAWLLEMLAQKGQNLESVCAGLALEDIGETPDDIAILTISRGF